MHRESWREYERELYLLVGNWRNVRPQIGRNSTLADWIVSGSAILKEGVPPDTRKQSPLLTIGAYRVQLS